MDPLTHALASYTLKRAAFPKANRRLTMAIVLAGSIASLDSLSAHVSPSAYLSCYRNASSSIFLALLIAIVFTVPFFLKKSSPPQNPSSPTRAFAAILSSALLHPLMDVTQAEPAGLLWPFSPRRFQLDWLPHADLWIFAILLAAVLLPQLFSLVSDEIGAKSKSPRGRFASTLALCTILLYIGLRALMHSAAIAAIEARTYRGELPRKVAAYPDANSPFLWQGVFETQSALHDAKIKVGPAADYDPESATHSYKPEPTIALDAATNTAAAKRFLATARFPKASIEHTPDGFLITIRDFPLNRESRAAKRVEAIIATDPAGKILSKEIAWDPASQGKPDR